MDCKLGAVWVSPTILIHVASILLGGKHAGSNVFVLELTRRLAMMTPQAVSLDELANFDWKNVRRPSVVGALDSAGSQPTVGVCVNALSDGDWAKGLINAQAVVV